jgi:hypothetical protein
MNAGKGQSSQWYHIVYPVAVEDRAKPSGSISEMGGDD